MRGPMKVIDGSSGLMECQVCGLRHIASIQSGLERADGVTRHHRGSYQCSDQQCPSNEKVWDEDKQQFIKPNWRKLKRTSQGLAATVKGEVVPPICNNVEDRVQAAYDRMDEEQKHQVKAWQVFHSEVSFESAVCYTLGVNPDEL